MFPSRGILISNCIYETGIRVAAVTILPSSSALETRLAWHEVKLSYRIWSNYSSCGLNVSFSLINEVVSINSSGLHLANSGISLYICIRRRGSAKVQTSIQPRGNSFTPHSSPELTQFCYLHMLNSMTGLSLAMGCACTRMCVSVCVYVRGCNSTSVTNKLACCSLAHWETPTAS